ncbi:unnamed protein product [Adineta steineri]|uniref:Uncharacterized protein n=1 Tax=Adineta steineri TaxID=433720 RepID=A0A818VBZ6_9BILA|nr:unnamed protein product [Adineta steineri]CAF3712907.1 unnamed protein product [Adineta steineri]
MHGFDFRSISLSDFDAIGRTYISATPDQITAICLSNSEHTPMQIDYFFEQGFKFSKFIHLQSLSIYYLPAGLLAHLIMDELQNLPKFSRLVYKSVYLSNSSFDVHYFISSIWNLTNLKYCCLKFEFGRSIMCFPVPSIVSSSIQYLTLENIEISSNEFIQLCEQTPNLQYLSTTLTFEYPFYRQLSIVPKITKAYIIYAWRSDQLITVLEMLPALSYLKLNIKDFAIDGYQVEKLIRENLPQLKDLYLRMGHTFDNGDNKEQEIDRILNTFGSPFWIDEHH